MAKQLCEAALAGNTDEILRLIVDENISVDALHPESNFPAVCFAAEAGHLNALQILAAYNANLAFSDRDGRTLMHFAAMSGNIELLKFLHGEGLAYNVLASGGRSLMHSAVFSESTTALDFLNEMGVPYDGYYASNKYKISPMHTAAAFGSIALIEHFHRKGISYEVTDFAGNTLLHYAARRTKLSVLFHRHDKNLSYLENSAKCFSLTPGNIAVIDHLLSKDLPVDAIDLAGNTAMHAAAENGNIDGIRHFHDKGIAFDVMNFGKLTPMSYAVSNNQPSVVKFLHDQGIPYLTADENNFIQYFSNLSDQAATLLPTMRIPGTIAISPQNMQRGMNTIRDQFFAAQPALAADDNMDIEEENSENETQAFQ